MKRSEINAAIARAMGELERGKISLPKFGYMTAAQWRESAENYAPLRALMLGWDVTDFGSGDFARCGAVLFTARNGTTSGAGTPYAEKYMFFLGESGQYIPLHCHINKTEDIINRAGGQLAVTLYASRRDEHNIYALDDSAEVSYVSDGVRYTVAAGSTVYIESGGSITLTPGIFHRLGARRGFGDLIAGEVSSINDDRSDNLFHDQTDRFCEIDEDTEITYPLCSDVL